MLKAAIDWINNFADAVGAGVVGSGDPGWLTFNLGPQARVRFKADQTNAMIQWCRQQDNVWSDWQGTREYNVLVDDARAAALEVRDDVIKAT